MSITGIIILILGIIAAIVLHELGHLVPAKIFGVKVPQYFIGFGSTLWSTTKRGTEYGIKAIPLGGFVRLAGMYAPAKPGTPLHNSKGQLTLAEEARRASAADLGEDTDQAFYKLSAPKKLAVMFGGPAMNLVIALGLATFLLVGIGAPTIQAGVGGVAPCVGECTEDSPASPAAEAGLQAGDEILAWGGMPTEEWVDVTDAIAAGGTTPTPVLIRRDGVEQTVVVTPVLTERPVFDAEGQPVMEGGSQKVEQAPVVGMSAAIGLERQSLTAVPGYVGDMMWATAGVIIRLPMKLWDLTYDLVVGNERDPQSLIGMVGVAGIAGQITGAEIEGYSFAEKSADLINLLIALNVSLFAFNMLPLLPLDGGHIVGALAEGGRRTIARLRGRPDPGPLDTARLMPMSYIVGMAFIVMTLILLVADIVNPVRF